MHVALNAYFWNRPETGSGQYLRQLLPAMAAAEPEWRFTLVYPDPRPPADPLPLNCGWLPVPTRAGHWGKLQFEQFSFPRAGRQMNADLLHVPYWGSPLRSPRPVVVTVHDLIPLVLREYRGGLLGRFYTGLVAAAARGAQAIITDSYAAQTDIHARLNVPAEQIRVVHLAADERFSPGRPDPEVASKYGLPGEYVLYLGGFDIRKNLAALLRAYTFVGPAIGDQFPLVLAGKPPAVPSPRFTDVPALIDRLEIGEWVRQVGFIDEVDKPAVYRGASVVVQLSHYEGFGLPPLEAMACGVPVVVSERSSLPEVVGSAGFVLDPDDVEGVAGAIIACAIQEPLQADLRQRGLEQAGRFSWQRTARQTLAAYRSALSE